MSKKRRRSKPQAQQPDPVKSGRKALLNYLLPFAFGVVITGGVAMLIAQGGKPDTTSPTERNLLPASRAIAAWPISWRCQTPNSSRSMSSR